MTDQPTAPTPLSRKLKAMVAVKNLRCMTEHDQAQQDLACDAIEALYRAALFAASDPMDAWSRAPLEPVDAPPVPASGEVEPIPMILPCPKCGMLHVDAPEPDKGWTNPPHKSHLCHGCGTVWRPADVATTGVAAITSRGKADTWDAALASPRACDATTVGATDEMVVAGLDRFQSLNRNYAIGGTAHREQMRAVLAAALAAAPKREAWIACSERMPHRETAVLLWVPVLGRSVEGQWSVGEWWTWRTRTDPEVYRLGAVTHWMPLPPPPAAQATDAKEAP